MLPIAPILSTSPFDGVNTSVGLNAIFCFELLHALSLKISKMSKKCLQLYLLYPSKSTSAIKYKSAQSKAYNRFLKSVWKLMNKFLKQAEARMRGASQGMDNSKAKNGGRITGLFRNTGVIGMLEGKDYKIPDLVSPFLDQIVNVCVVIRELVDNR